RSRLPKRGVTLSMTLAGSMLAGGLATGAVPTALSEATLRAAVPFALRRSLGGSVSSGALALAEGGLKAMFAGKLSVVALSLAAIVLLASAGLIAGKAGLEVGQQAVRPGEDSDRHVDRYGDPLPPGVVSRLGTVRLRPGNDWLKYLAFLPD